MAILIKKMGKRFALSVPPSFGLKEALQWLMLVRLFVLYTVLAAVVVQHIVRPQAFTNEDILFAYTLLTLSFLINLVQSVLLPQIKFPRTCSFFNIIFDSLLTSIWLYHSGSAASLFPLVYLIQILAVALTFYQKGAIIAAFTSCLFYAVVSFSSPAGFTEWTPWAIYSGLFMVLGIVGGYLSEELLRTTKRLEEKTKKFEELSELHERIIHDIPTGLMTVDHEEKISFINPAGEHILGKHSRDLVGKNIQESIHDFLPFFNQIESQEIKGEMEEDEEQTALTATGTDVRRNVFLQPKAQRGSSKLQFTVEVGHGKNSKIIRGDVAALEAGSFSSLGRRNEKGGRVLLFQDVTKLVHLEEKLKQNDKLAAVGQLAAGIAHEIRNPLAGMSASIQLLKGSIQPGALDQEGQKLMDIAIREIDRLNDLITEFLDFVKPEKMKMGSVNLSGLLAEIGEIVKKTKEAKSVEFIESFSDCLVQGNTEKLKQVALNLLMNAVQAMPNGGKLEVGCKAMEHRVLFWVQDSGIGMSEDVLNRLYEPFFTTKDKGTGLGLATVHKIIDSHQGEIRVTSRPKEGTRFEVYLQRA